MRRRRSLALVLAAAVVGAVGSAAGCGGDTAAPAPHPADAPPTARERAERRERRERQRPAHPPVPRCARAADNCRSAAGRVLGLESKDADGDGDLHLILAGGSITLPGITVLDINKHLRPREDPRIGDWAAGAGPVYSGSYGQRQIQVERVAFDPRRG